MTSPSLEPGARLAGCRIVRVLGRGGMGTVYEAVDEQLGRAVALKVLSLESPDDRFRREAQAMAALAHPNLVVVHRAGEEGGRAFMVLELMPGGSLEDRLRGSGRLPWREAARLGAQVARGLAVLHAAGLVHRDLKPANVLLDGSGQARLSDFGLVRVEQAERLTRTGEVVGTLLYMAPEQIEGSKGVDARADLYSLGVTLHELLTGEPPFRGVGHELMKHHLLDRPPSVLALAPETPRALAELVLELQEKVPADRGPGAASLAKRLEWIAAEEEPDGSRSRRGLAASLGVLALALGLGAFALSRAASKPAASDMRPTPAPSGSPRPTPSPSPRPTPSPTPSPDPSEQSAQRSWRRTALIGSDQWQCGHLIRSLAFSADGRIVLAGGDGGQVTVWDAATGELVRARPAWDPVQSVALSASGRLALSPDPDGSVTLWEVATGRRFYSFKNLEFGRADAWLAFSPDEARALVCSKSSVHLYDTSTGAEKIPAGKQNAQTGIVGVMDLKKGGGGFSCGVLSPDGKRVALGGDGGGMGVVGLDGGHIAGFQFVHHDGGPVTIALSADGLRALSGSPGDDKVLLWDLKKNGTFGAGSELDHGARAFTFMPDSRHALIAGDDGTIKVWDVVTRETVSEPIPFPGRRLTAIAAAPDGIHALAASDDGRVYSWKIGEAIAAPSSGAMGPLTTVALARDGRHVLAGTSEGSAWLLDTESPGSGTHLGSFPPLVASSSPPVTCSAFSSSGARAASGHSDGFLRTWSVATGRLESATDLGRGPVRCCAFLGEDAVAGTESGSLVLYRGGVLRRWDGLGSRILAVATAEADERRVFVATNLRSDGLVPTSTQVIVRVDVLAEGDALVPVCRFPYPATGVALTPGWALEWPQQGASVLLLNLLAPEQPPVTLEKSGGSFTGVPLPEYRTITASGSGLIQWWETTTGTEIDRIDLGARGDRPTCLAAAPDGHKLIVGTQRGLVLAYELEKP